jgi:hypothetical protein
MKKLNRRQLAVIRRSVQYEIDRTRIRFAVGVQSFVIASGCQTKREAQFYHSMLLLALKNLATEVINEA